MRHGLTFFSILAALCVVSSRGVAEIYTEANCSKLAAPNIVDGIPRPATFRRTPDCSS